MSSNKKTTLTGYLPDILMAAAAVRLRLPRHMRATRKPMLLPLTNIFPSH